MKACDLKMQCVGVRGETTQMCSSAWRHVSCGTEPLSSTWGSMRSPMASRLPQVCRSAQDDLSGTFKNVIEAIFVAVMQRAVVFAV